MGMGMRVEMGMHGAWGTAARAHQCLDRPELGAPDDPTLTRDADAEPFTCEVQCFRMEGAEHAAKSAWNTVQQGNTVHHVVV